MTVSVSAFKLINRFYRFRFSSLSQTELAGFYLVFIAIIIQNLPQPYNDYMVKTIIGQNTSCVSDINPKYSHQAYKIFKYN